MPDDVDFVHLRQALSPVPQAYQGIAATLGLLTHSALNHTRKMPEICYLLKALFKLSSCGFFWSDRDGNMQDAWCLSPEFLSFKTLISCLEYQNSGNRVWPTFQENVLMGATAGYLLPFQNERFYASPHYQATYGSINVRYILDVVLHDGTRPFGALLLMRSVQQGPFTPDERNCMVKLVPILNRAFTSTSVNETQYSEKELTGFALVDQGGKSKSMSKEAKRIVWMLTHTQPGSFADPNAPSIEQSLEQLVAKYMAAIRSGNNSSIDIENRWGRFNLAFEQEPKTLDTIITLRRKVPLPSQLAFNLTRLDFPPARQMVAWLLAQNYSRNEIAKSLRISVETVTSHIKLIYKATGTSSSHDLLLKLANQPPLGAALAELLRAERASQTDGLQNISCTPE